MNIVNKRKIKESPYPEKTQRDLMKGSVVIIDKPKGPFSYEITDRVKKALRAKKTGHAGTLDPNATGVLPIGVNKGCHLLRAISNAPKAYEGVMHVHTQVSLSKVVSASKKFIGKIIQKLYCPWKLATFFSKITKILICYPFKIFFIFTRFR